MGVAVGVWIIPKQTHVPCTSGSMTSYASKSSYEFTETPKTTPQKAPKPETPSGSETPTKTSGLSCTSSYSFVCCVFCVFADRYSRVNFFPSSGLAFFSSKWGSITAKASEVAQKARGRLHEIVQSNPSTPLNVSQETIGTSFVAPLTTVEARKNRTNRFAVSFGVFWQIGLMLPGKTYAQMTRISRAK